MIIKSRSEPLELTILRLLKPRMELSEKDLNNYWSHEKGFTGELKFDQLLLEHLPNEWLVIGDLLLEHNNTYFQIDNVLISQETIYLIDVKYFKGDYFIESDNWYSEFSHKEIKNPLVQLERSESLFRRYIQVIGFNFTIESYLVFNHTEFTLYKAPRNPSFIFPSQLNRFMNKLKKTAVNPKEKHVKLAQKLDEGHIEKNPYLRIPHYSYDRLEKAIICKKCGSFISHVQDYSIICNQCGHKENVQSAVLRSVEEYRILFPDRRITTNYIYEWCGKIILEKRIQRILGKNFKMIGHGKTAYYVSS